MECERLKKLIKNWYIQVQDESMAPARMVDFMRNHVEDCMTCMGDPLIEIEVKRITEIVLPPAKVPKAVRKDKDSTEDDATEDDGADDDDDVPSDEDDDIDPDEEDEEDDEEDEI
jgi:hypothetical protein